MMSASTPAGVDGGSYIYLSLALRIYYEWIVDGIGSPYCGGHHLFGDDPPQHRDPEPVPHRSIITYHHVV